MISLSSCQAIWKNSSSNPEASFQKDGTYPNQVDLGAKKINAKYAKEYNLAGNIIAHYPDFNIRLVSTKIKGNETISLFEISSKNGLEKDFISCTTSEPDKKHLYIENLHFFYHSNEPGKINIYFPPMLIVKSNTPNLTTTL